MKDIKTIIFIIIYWLIFITVCCQAQIKLTIDSANISYIDTTLHKVIKDTTFSYTSIFVVNHNEIINNHFSKEGAVFEKTIFNIIFKEYDMNLSSMFYTVIDIKGREYVIQIKQVKGGFIMFGTQGNSPNLFITNTFHIISISEN